MSGMSEGDVQEETTRLAAEACAAGIPPEVRMSDGCFVLVVSKDTDNYEALRNEPLWPRIIGMNEARGV